MEEALVDEWEGIKSVHCEVDGCVSLNAFKAVAPRFCDSMALQQKRDPSLTREDADLTRLQTAPFYHIENALQLRNPRCNYNNNRHSREQRQTKKIGSQTRRVDARKLNGTGGVRHAVVRAIDYR